jgi:hypothetical protein
LIIPFVLCLEFVAGLCLPSAQAIPVAGNYLFVSGDPNISGTFTSTGSVLSSWSFSSNLFSRVFLNNPFPYTTLLWNSSTDIVQPGTLNNQNHFITNNALITGDQFSGHYAQLQWNADPSILNAVFRVDETCCDAIYHPPPTVSFVLAVPEPDILLLTLAGMIGVAIYAEWKRRRANQLFS